MSNARFHIMPVDPYFIPEPAAQLEAAKFWQAKDPSAAAISLRFWNTVYFIMPGEGGFEGSYCPECDEGIDERWIYETHQELSKSGHIDLNVIMPCCGASVNLNTFEEFGFARFTLNSMDADIEIVDTLMPAFEKILGCKLHIMYDNI